MVSVILDEHSRYESDVFVYDPNPLFNNEQEPEWFNDPLIREMILDVDESKVLSANCIESPVLGQIAPERLSGGVKALILMYEYPQYVVNASACGNNCAKWILEIGKKQDFTIRLGYPMEFPEPLQLCIAGSNRMINSYKEFIHAWCVEEHYEG